MEKHRAGSVESLSGMGSSHSGSVDMLNDPTFREESGTETGLDRTGPCGWPLASSSSSFCAADGRVFLSP